MAQTPTENQAPCPTSLKVNTLLNSVYVSWLLLLALGGLLVAGTRTVADMQYKDTQLSDRLARVEKALDTLEGIRFDMRLIKTRLGIKE